MSDVGKEECSKLRKLVIFGILSRLGHFPQVFGQVKDWLVLQFNEMIKVPNAVAFPMDFNLLCYREVSREEYKNKRKMIIF